MPCYYPVTGYRSKVVNPSGKRSIVHNPKYGFIDMPVQRPCGYCIGCRLKKARNWAVRCLHESECYEKNIFITLTYSPEHLPIDSSLQKPHFQKFMKDLRDWEYRYYRSILADRAGSLKKLRQIYGSRKNISRLIKNEFKNGIRFYMCGEYGEQKGRPHYHSILFNFDFPDKTYFTKREGFPIYTSEILNSLWPYGYSEIGSVTYESIAYVARYIMKKSFGPDSYKDYETVNLFGEITSKAKEYTDMSRRPGIGQPWIKKYKNDVYPSDQVIIRKKMNSCIMSPPPYYDSVLEILDSDMLAMIKLRRKINSSEHADDNTPERLAVREKIQKAKLSLLKRSFENV